MACAHSRGGVNGKALEILQTPAPTGIYRSMTKAPEFTITRSTKTGEVVSVKIGSKTSRASETSQKVGKDISSKRSDALRRLANR